MKQPNGKDYSSSHSHIETSMITIIRTCKNGLSVYAKRGSPSNTSVPLNMSQKEQEIITHIITCLFTPNTSLKLEISHLSGKVDTLNVSSSAISNPDNPSQSPEDGLCIQSQQNTWLNILLNKVNASGPLKASVQAIAIHIHPSNDLDAWNEDAST